MGDESKIKQAVVIVKDRESIGLGAVSFAENYMKRALTIKGIKEEIHDLPEAHRELFLAAFTMGVAFVAADIIIGAVHIGPISKPGFTSGENDNSERGHNEQTKDQKDN